MRKGFTLIELLIVVAIIAILAAIAVPNFLEAQVRAKVSRAKNDMRSYATALESYRVDQNSYPPDHPFGIPVNLPPGTAGAPVVPASGILERLSTPISYISQAAFQNPFKSPRRISNANAQGIANFTGTPTEVPSPDRTFPAYNSYLYYGTADNGRVSWANATEAGDTFNSLIPLNAQAWLMQSPGPNEIYFNMGGVLDNSSEGRAGRPTAGSTFGQCLNLIYDPTNGTISFGNIWRSGGNSAGGYARNMHRAVENQR